jgi:chromate transporter
MMIFIELFVTFFIIGIFTIGGGYAMLSLIQNEVVIAHQWISPEAFTDMVAISQMTPGPIGINIATYVGYAVPESMGHAPCICILGSTLATAAVVLPSFLITYWISKLYYKFKEKQTFSNIMQWLKSVVIGLIAAAAIGMMTSDTLIDYWSWILLVAAFIACMWLKLNPIYAIILGALSGIAIYYY